MDASSDPTPTPAPAAEPTPEDLLGAAAASPFGRIVPAVGLLGLILVLIAILRRRSGGAAD